MTKLTRALTWREGAGFAVASVLGSGVLILPALTANIAGPAALVAWALMSLAVIPMAFTLGQLAVHWPDAGGIAAYARQAFGDRVARAVGFLYLGTVPVGAPAATLIGVGYVSGFFHWPHLAGVALAAALLATALFTNALGVELSGRAATGVVMLISLILLAAVATAWPHVHQAAFTPFAPHGWSAVGAAGALLFWAFVGWEMLGHMAEEFVAPKRDIPRALTIAIVAIDALYLAVAFVTIGTHMYGPGKTADGLSQLVGLTLGVQGSFIVVGLAVLVTYGTVHTYVAGFSRLVYAQARAGDLPSGLGILHARYHSPTRVLAILTVPFAIALIWDAISPFPLQQLIAWPSAIFITLYVIAMASGWKLLPGRQKWAGLLGGLVSATALPFTGWGIVLPLLIFAAAWLAGPRPRAAASNQAEHEGLQVGVRS